VCSPYARSARWIVLTAAVAFMRCHDVGNGKSMTTEGVEKRSRGGWSPRVVDTVVDRVAKGREVG